MVRRWSRRHRDLWPALLLAALLVDLSISGYCEEDEWSAST